MTVSTNARGEFVRRELQRWDSLSSRGRRNLIGILQGLTDDNTAEPTEPDQQDGEPNVASLDRPVTEDL